MLVSERGPGSVRDEFGPWTPSSACSWHGGDDAMRCGQLHEEEVPKVLEPASQFAPRDAVSDGELPDTAPDDEDGAPRSTWERKVFRKMLRNSKIFFDSYPRDVVMSQASEVGIARAQSADAAALLWYEADPPSLEVIRAMEPGQRINVFPGMKLLATKCEFARVVNLARSMVAGTPQSDLFSFVPETFVLPRDKALLAMAPAAMYVVKPDAGCGGDGIYLTADVGNIRHNECVVQKYIANPLLLGGLKFDLRVYVLVTSLRPLRFHVHKEGLARLAVEPYEPPSQKNIYKTNMHLTNYSLNKFSSKFIPNTDSQDDATCSKRSITTAFRQLKEQYGADVFDADDVWEGISSIAETTLTVLLPCLLMAAKERSSNSTSLVDKCFQIMGFDILLDSNVRPHLLEVNHHPSLLTDAPIDTLVKGSLLKYTLRVVSHETALRFDAKRQARRAKKSSSKKNLLSADDDGDSSQRSVDFDVPASRAEWEAAVAGDMFISVTSQGDQSATPLARRFNLPLNVLRDVFLEGGEDARSRRSAAACNMTSLKFAKFMRRVGLVPDHISSGAADLMYIRAAKQGGVMCFLDFAALIMEDLGDLVAPETARGTAERLAAAAAFLAAALPE